MVEIVLEEKADIKGKYLVEGFPGAGLVGKIVAEHIIEQLGLEYKGFIDSEELPDMAMFKNDEYEVQPAVRIYARTDTELVVLNADIPVSADAQGFLDELHGWIIRNELKPLYQSGLPVNRRDEPELFGISSGGAHKILKKKGIEAPPTLGFISGPTGALLHRSRSDDTDAIGLIVESESWLPDPEAAKTVIEKGIVPITGADIDTSPLVETADEIRRQKEAFAERIRSVEEHRSSEAFPSEMYR